tara:strand:- start:205 stop:336 length:132 start_codon:yes stop_codon:yes gene_type:complete
MAEAEQEVTLVSAEQVEIFSKTPDKTARAEQAVAVRLERWVDS